VVDIADDTKTTDEDTPVGIDVLANDSFEGSGRAVTQIDGIDIASGGSVAVTNGTVTLNADGTLSFSPASNFNGPTSFSYTVSSGGVSETATVNMTVSAVNDVPVPTPLVPSTPSQTFDPATGNYAAETQEDTPFSGQLAATDDDGDTLSYTVSASPSHGAVTLDAATGAYTYTPAADYHGSDSFTVTISDGNGGTVETTVNMSVAALADAVDDELHADEDMAVSSNLLTGTNGANADNFEDTGRTITAVTQGAHGSVTFQADGTVTYTPDTGFNGSDSFSYTVTAGGVTETATVTVNIAPVNNIPVNTVPGAQSTTEDTAMAISGVSVADADSASLTTTLSVTHGTLDVATGGGATITGNGSANVVLSGTEAQIRWPCPTAPSP
jgi:hypothetical protein